MYSFEKEKNKYAISRNGEKDFGSTPTSFVRSIIYVFAALILLLTSTACQRSSGLPEPESEDYRNLVAAFYVGLAGLQTGEDTRAQESLTRAAELAPGEPAAWANLGLLAVRQQDFETAYERVEKARSLAPDNSHIETLLGLIESRRGNLAEATTHLQRAVELDSKNLRALYALAEETERQGNETSDAQAQELLERILETQPDNLAVILDVTRLAAKRGENQTLRSFVARLSEKSAAWPDQAKHQMTALQEAASGTNPRAAAVQVAFLRNVLARVPAYRESLNAVKSPAEFVGEPFLKFVKLPSPSSEPAPADPGLEFPLEEVPEFDAEKWTWTGVILLDHESAPLIAAANSEKLRIQNGETLPFPGKDGGGVFRNSVLTADLNYDFKTDIVLAGAGGVKLYQQRENGKFVEITPSTELPAEVTSQSYYGVWGFDVDLDGDLDVVLGRQDGDPIVLRNNGNGTFTVIDPFQGAGSIVHFATADVDSDGDPDVATVNIEKRLTLFINERFASFRSQAVPEMTSQFVPVETVAAADIDGNGVTDFVFSTSDNQIFQLSSMDGDNSFQVRRIAIPDSASFQEEATNLEPGEAGLFSADLDNNGSLDIVNSHVLTDIYLGSGNSVFEGLPKDASRTQGSVGPVSRVYAVVDVNGDGRLDLVGLNNEGSLFYQINRGTKNYHYQVLRTRAAKATGDQRINSFGIGGEIEIRSGLLTQKQVITSPILHFGLGENTQTDVARIIWPNGSVQAEFELEADQSILAEQRLKGSCPMLFAWDGKQISYVKDTAPWSPALGLHVNAQVVAGIYRTEEWFKIRGDQLVPRDGIYDLRVTAELWETYYIDHYSLMVVDHPVGTEVFVDERFAVPPPPLKLHATGPTKPFARARDDLGQDVSAVVCDLDAKYLDTFGKGRYQGVTRDHWVELELPADAPHDKPLYLIGHGFVQPTDGSINIAYSQTGYPPPQGLTIETPDADGRWTVAKSGKGFPAGKLKTVVLDMDGIFHPGAPRRLRLRTNMEIYWDKLEWAEALPEETLKTQRIDLSSAELLYRGFSRFSQANDSSPELPDYNHLEGTAPKWRNLIGYYTRHGDVRELLEKVDDRIVIICAGDELRLEFTALRPPPEGWTRDYVMIGDGWIKDGDLNSTFSETVLPLPYHGLEEYNTAPGRLEDDPAYKRNPQDWQLYHTRYVTPEVFLKALRQ